MKKVFLAFAMLLMMAACTQNKSSQATVNEKETAAQTEAADTINPETRLEAAHSSLQQSTVTSPMCVPLAYRRLSTTVCIL